MSTGPFQKCEIKGNAITAYFPTRWALIACVTGAIVFSPFIYKGLHASGIFAIWAWAMAIMLPIAIVYFLKDYGKHFLHFMITPESILLGVPDRYEHLHLSYDQVEGIAIGRKYHGVRKPVVFKLNIDEATYCKLNPQWRILKHIRGDSPNTIAYTYSGADRKAVIDAITQVIRGRIPVVEFDTDETDVMRT